MYNSRKESKWPDRVQKDLQTLLFAAGNAFMVRHTGRALAEL